MTLRDPDDLCQFRSIDGLAFEQQSDHPIERVTVPVKQGCRSGLGLQQQPGDLPVDGTLRFLGIGAAREGIVPARPFGPVADRPDHGRETPLANHSGGEIGRARQVVGRAGRRLAKYFDLSGSTPEANRQRVG